MPDVGYVLLLLVALSAVGGLVGARLGRTILAPWLLGVGILWAFFYAVVFYDRLSIVRLMPQPVMALIVGNSLLLPTTVGLAAMASPRLSGSTLRRFALLTPLVLGGAWHALSPWVGSPPPTDDLPTGLDAVVRQTSDSSCSAASAATILVSAGIPATETELVKLCLTRNAGTPMLGVYRGLSRKTVGTLKGVSVLSRASISDLRQATRSGPVLISVGLDRWQRGYDPRYVSEWGWTPGKRHAVVLFGFLPGGKLDIGDPAVGREKWDQEALTVLWNGEGLQLRSLVGRERSGVSADLERRP